MFLRSWRRSVGPRNQVVSGSCSAGRRPHRGTNLYLEWLENRTVPSFLPAVPSPVGVRPRAIAVADLTNDGAPDIAVVNQGQFPNFDSSLSVLVNNGDGSFQSAVATDVLTGSNFGATNSVAVGDVNGDGLPDVALTSSTSHTVEVLLGNGDGSFQIDHLLISVGQNPTSVAVGDFDGNGALDLVTANGGSDTVSLLLGNGDGSFQPRIDLAVGSEPHAVAVHDF